METYLLEGSSRQIGGKEEEEPASHSYQSRRSPPYVPILREAFTEPSIWAHNILSLLFYYTALCMSI